jgi:hypothetical protein
LLGLFGLKAGVGAHLHLGLRALELGFALLAALHFGGNRQAVLQGRGVGLVGFGQQLGDLQIERAQRFLGVTVAHGGVFARVGQDLRAVDGDRDLTDLQHAAPRGQFQDLLEGLGQQRTVLAPESAERVVIGVGVSAEQTHRDVFVTRALDLTARKHPRRVTVDEQRQQHPGRILLAAGAALVDRRRARVDQLDRIDHKMHQVIRRHPVPQVGRQQQRRVSVNIHVSSHIQLLSNY